MIQAEEFVEAGRRRGFEWYAGVPCSFLTPFINYVINDDKLTHISSANEGDAVATAAGAMIGGRRAVAMMQNSGLGNAVSPLTSLTYVFRIPLLVICTHRGAPGLKDEPQHELMGQITGAMFDTMETLWEPFPTESQAIEPALERASQFMMCEQRPYAFVMSKGAVAPHPLKKTSLERSRDTAQTPQGFFKHCGRPSRNEALHRVIERTPVENTVVVATTGYTGRELYALADRPNHLYMVGSMGCASSFGLGLSLARPDLTVVVVDGDGAALMRMGNFATLGAYGGSNLIHLVLDNEAHDSTGAQSTVSAGVYFARIAQSCGYGLCLEGDSLELVDILFTAQRGDRPRFGHLKIRTGTIEDLPRPSVTPPEVVRRLMSHIGSSF